MKQLVFFTLIVLAVLCYLYGLSTVWAYILAHPILWIIALVLLGISFIVDSIISYLAIHKAKTLAKQQKKENDEAKKHTANMQRIELHERENLADTLGSSSGDLHRHK